MAALVLTLALVLGWAAAARAHETRPDIANLLIAADGTVEVSIAVNLEALIAGIGPTHANTADAPQAAEYDRLRALGPAALHDASSALMARYPEGLHLVAGGTPVQLEVISAEIPAIGDLTRARISTIALRGTLPATAGTLTWGEDYADSVIRVAAKQDGQIYHSAYVPAGAHNEPIAVHGGEVQSTLSIFANYLVIGYEHILPKGLDHILFVIGLFFLSTRLRALLWQVTGFTVAHTVTLALGMAGVVSLPSSVVEPLIAASIVYVAVENVMTDRLTRWRPFVVFGFGLLHGLGFAGVLTEIGLAPAHFVAGLIAFNLGVELGQLSVIMLCFGAVGLWFRSRSWYRSVIAVPASLAIAVTGAWWFVERVAL